MTGWLCLAITFIPFVLFGISIVAVPLLLVRHEVSSLEDRWRQDARLLGLTYVDSPHKGVNGRYGGLDLRVRRLARRDRSLSTSHRGTLYFTLVEIHLQQPPPSGLDISREDAADKVSKLVGGQDIEVGHPRFDATFRVRASEPDGARAYLQREGVIDAFGHLHRLSHQLELRGRVLYVEVKRARHGEDLRELLDELDRVVSVIDARETTQAW